MWVFHLYATRQGRIHQVDRWTVQRLVNSRLTYKEIVLGGKLSTLVTLITRFLS